MSASVNRHPNQIPLVSFLIHNLGLIHQHVAADPTPLINWQTLDNLEEGSLGRALLAHLNQHQLQPFAHGPRRLQLHDTVHVLTGYGVDLPGEIEVQAFLLGCKFGLRHILLGLGLLYKQLWIPHPDLQTLWQRSCAAFQRGRNSHFDPDQEFPNELWSQPLHQARQCLGIPNT